MSRATPRKIIIARRKRLEAKQAKIKELQKKLKAEEKRIAKLTQKDEDYKLIIIGKIMNEKMKADSSLKAWFNEEIEKKLKRKHERALFDL